VVVDLDFKAATVGWDQGNALNLWLELLQQVGYQTGSTFGVVSDSTILYGDFH
jgi:hypothetical protein